jgi:hypothetical protein
MESLIISKSSMRVLSCFLNVKYSKLEAMRKKMYHIEWDVMQGFPSDKGLTKITLNGRNIGHGLTLEKGDKVYISIHFTRQFLFSRFSSEILFLLGYSLLIEDPANRTFAPINCANLLNSYFANVYMPHLAMHRYKRASELLYKKFIDGLTYKPITRVDVNELKKIARNFGIKAEFRSDMMVLKWRNVSVGDDNEGYINYKEIEIGLKYVTYSIEYTRYKIDNFIIDTRYPFYNNGTSDQTKFHPHIDYHSFCMGNRSDDFDAYKASGMVPFVFEVINSCVKEYSPDNPFIRITKLQRKVQAYSAIAKGFPKTDESEEEMSRKVFDMRVNMLRGDDFAGLISFTPAICPHCLQDLVEQKFPNDITGYVCGNNECQANPSHRGVVCQETTEDVPSNCHGEICGHAQLVWNSEDFSYSAIDRPHGRCSICGSIYLYSQNDTHGTCVNPYCMQHIADSDLWDTYESHRITPSYQIYTYGEVESMTTKCDRCGNDIYFGTSACYCSNESCNRYGNAILTYRGTIDNQCYRNINRIIRLNNNFNQLYNSIVEQSNHQDALYAVALKLMGVEPVLINQTEGEQT